MCNFGSFVVSNLIKWVQLNKLRKMGSAEHNVQQLLSQFQVSLFDLQLTECHTVNKHSSLRDSFLQLAASYSMTF